jgi:isopentenyl-diphosphate delta-isomerase
MYKEKLDNELTEYEFDHVFIGFSDDMPVINTREVADWTKKSFEDLHGDILADPSNYTVWFRKIYQRVNRFLLNSKNY